MEDKLSKALLRLGELVTALTGAINTLVYWEPVILRWEQQQPSAFFGYPNGDELIRHSTPINPPVNQR
jgi:hypothetical protein